MADVHRWLDPIFQTAWMLDVATALTVFAVFLAFHLFIWRRVGAERAGFALMTALWLASLVLVLSLSLAFTPRLGSGLAPAALRPLTVIAIDGALMAFYLHLYTGMLRSVSLRILGEMLIADGRLTRTEIDHVYSASAMLESRLQWLVERGWILREERVVREERTGTQTYALTDAGRRVLAVRRPLASWLVEGQTG